MSGSSPETDATLEDLPELKADLEEARQLISRLEDRKEETDPDRYQNVRQRYEQQIEELEPTVQKLTDQGESRKQDLEDRLADQKEKAQEAEAELTEIKQLHEEGAMGEEIYQEDRRRLQQQKNGAEKKASRLERELEEVKFYLTEVGKTDYQGEGFKDQVLKFEESLRAWFEGKLGGVKVWAAWGGMAVILLSGMLYWVIGGFSKDWNHDYPTANYIKPHKIIGMSEEGIREVNSEKRKIDDNYTEGGNLGVVAENTRLEWVYVPKNKYKSFHKNKIKAYVKESAKIFDGRVLEVKMEYFFKDKGEVSDFFHSKVEEIRSETKSNPDIECGDNILPNGDCGWMEWGSSEMGFDLWYNRGRVVNLSVTHDDYYDQYGK